MTTSPQTDTTSELEDSIEINATPAQVWALVSDVKRMAEWSPQVLRSFVRRSVGGTAGPDSSFVNINHRGPLVWPTTAKVVRFTPHSDFAFRINENWTIWSFALEPNAAGGTTLTQRRETPKGISGVSKSLTKTLLGGQAKFTGELQAGMRQTLEQIKAAAER